MQLVAVFRVGDPVIPAGVNVRALHVLPVLLGHHDERRVAVIFCVPSGGHAFLEMETTLQMQNATYSQLVTELARISGKDITFSPKNPDMTFNVGFQRATFWDALKLLSEQGTVQVAGQDFEKLKRLRRSLLNGEKFSFCVTNTPVNTFVSDMVGLTGLPLRITAGKPTAMVNVRLRDAALSDMLRAVSEQTGTKIVEEGADSDGQ
jgi:hypothetical protein